MLYKPIQMNWDPQGRLWVASSRLYPQIKPGQDAEDAVIVLEDTNGDGKADQHTVFADGLVIPTGVVPDGRGGLLRRRKPPVVAHRGYQRGREGDTRTIVYLSFGTEDTHHNLHTPPLGLRRSSLPQSIDLHSHPPGDAAGRPTSQQRGNLAVQSGHRIHGDFHQGWMQPVGTPLGPVWQFLLHGRSRIQGGLPCHGGATYFTYSDMPGSGQHQSGELSEVRQPRDRPQPDVSARLAGKPDHPDFRAHRVVRFQLTEVGSTFQTKEMPDLLAPPT